MLMGVDAVIDMIRTGVSVLRNCAVSGGVGAGSTLQIEYHVFKMQG